MISTEELVEIKTKRNTNLYYAEKEYLQYIFLHAISRFPDFFTFKGGTCLRICYNYERSSEDLDFSTILDMQRLRSTIKECLKDFKLLGIKHSVYSEKEFEGNIRFEIRFEGPLFTGHMSSTNTLKIDFNKSKTIHRVAKVVPRLFSDIPVFTIVALDEKEILTEKIRSLVNRKLARDIYDVWLLLHNGIEIDKGLLIQKLNEEKSDIKKLQFPSREEYERDLRGLVSYLPPYEQIKVEVEKTLKQIIQR